MIRLTLPALAIVTGAGCHQAVEIGRHGLHRCNLRIKRPSLVDGQLADVRAAGACLRRHRLQAPNLVQRESALPGPAYKSHELHRLWREMAIPIGAFGSGRQQAFRARELTFDARARPARVSLRRLWGKPALGQFQSLATGSFPASPPAVPAPEATTRPPGKTYDAIVTGRTPSRTFVRICTPTVEGMLVGRGTDRDVGEQLRVKLVSTNVKRGFIDFVAVGGGVVG